MSEAFLMRRGGSVNNAYALIAVSYPANSTCTAAKETKTLTARSSNGAYCFSIPEAGTWTVTITDGTNTATQDVVISSAGQVEKLVMSYANDLFFNGAGAGNWTAAPDVYWGGTATIGDRLYLNAKGLSQGAQKAYIYLTDAISFAGKQSLAVSAITNIGGFDHPELAQVRVVEETKTHSSTPDLEENLEAGVDVKTTVLDVSGLDSSKKYRVVLYASGYYFDDQQGGITAIEATVNVSRVTLS